MVCDVTISGPRHSPIGRLTILRAPLGVLTNAWQVGEPPCPIGVDRPSSSGNPEEGHGPSRMPTQCWSR